MTQQNYYNHQVNTLCTQQVRHHVTLEHLIFTKPQVEFEGKMRKKTRAQGKERRGKKWGNTRNGDEERRRKWRKVHATREA